MARDNFHKSTSEILARRVAYICSNPDCNAPTIGPNVDNGKSTSVVEAAHITAASPGGPRYDASITSMERMSLDNGIHLCRVCAAKIDRDPKRYTVELLKAWKMQAEEKALINLGKPRKGGEEPVPFLEPDLIWESGGRWHRGNSYKNLEKEKSYGGNLTPNQLIVHWELIWRYQLVVLNNSSKMAKNIRIEQISMGDIIKLPTLAKINNLPPYEQLDLTGRYTEWMEGTGAEADVKIKQKIPESLDGLQVKISYQDELGNRYQTITTVSKGELSTIMEK